MKKEYINPEMEIIKIQTMSVLAQSLGQGQGEKPADDADASRWFDNGGSEDW